MTSVKRSGIKRIILICVLTLLLKPGTSVLAAGGFTLPDKPASTPSATEAVVETLDSADAPCQTAPSIEATAPPVAKSDKEFMDGITLAFMDGIRELTPDNAHANIQAVMVGVPEERGGSAQWFIDGVPQAEYYSSDFSIYNGRITEMEFTVPFSKGMENSVMKVALEVHLNGIVRRIEKEIKLCNYDDEWYKMRDTIRIYSLVQPVDIEATVRYWTHTYSNKWLGESNGSLSAGSRVIYTDHSGTTAACIWIPEEGRSCWVPYSSISISNKDYTVYEDFADSDKELFVNTKEYESTTPYLIWINLQRQKVNVFEGSKENWKLIKTATCSSGANTTPTPAGVMTYCAYGSGWYHPTYYVRPILYMNLSRGIAMHSILFSPNGTVQDGTQGTPASHGCVRMLPDDINWLAQYVPIGTTVVVF